MQIIDAIKETLDRTPPELASDIMDRGIMLAGGGSLLQGLDERLREETQMPAHRAESPLTCVAVGSRPLPRGVRGDPPVQPLEQPQPSRDAASLNLNLTPILDVTRMHDKAVRRRRAVLVVLVAASLILLTAYFGESSDGRLHAVQRGALGTLSPDPGGRQPRPQARARPVRLVRRHAGRQGPARQGDRGARPAAAAARRRQRAHARRPSSRPGSTTSTTWAA